MSCGHLHLGHGKAIGELHLVEDVAESSLIPENRRNGWNRSICLVRSEREKSGKNGGNDLKLQVQGVPVGFVAGIPGRDGGQGQYFKDYLTEIDPGLF